MFPPMATRPQSPEYSDEVPTISVPLQDAQGAAKETARRSSFEHVDIPQQSTRHSSSGGRFSALKRVFDSKYFPVSALVPSFLQRTNDISPRRQHPSAWLDGVRGVAAFFVVCHHASLMWFSWDIHGGWAPGMGQPWLYQLFKLPIIRLFISGPPQVALFFVVSGYAISYKPLRLMRQGRFAEVGATLCSSVFRRHTRLFLPAVIVTFFCALATQMDQGWFPDGLHGQQGAVIPALPPPHLAGLMDQLWNWAATQVVHANPIKNGLAQGDQPNVADNPYDPPLWTLPVEFSGSMIVFGFLVAFTRVRGRVRMAAALLVAFYVQYYFVFWAVFAFIGGMFICDLHFEVDEVLARRAESSGGSHGYYDNVLPVWAARVHQNHVSRIITKFTRSYGMGRVVRRVCGVAAFVFALMLLSVPERHLGASMSWGYATITSWAPIRFGDHLLVPLGAVLTVLVLDLAPFLQILFSNPFSQYLGRISFAIYLIHGPLLWSVGSKLTNYFIGLTGGNTGPAFVIAIFLASCFWWILAIYLADLTATYVDQPVLQFTRWAYGKLSRKDPQQGA